MTTRDDILRMAREAGFQTGVRDYADGDGAMPFVQSVATGTFLPELERFHALATERERAARQAAQAENEELKARLARAGVEQRRAVLAMRKRCAEEADYFAANSRCALLIANTIRSFNDLDAPDMRPSDTHILNCPTGLRSDQQLETLVTAPEAQDPPIFTWCELVRNNLAASHLSGFELRSYIDLLREDIIRNIGRVSQPTADMTEALALLDQHKAQAVERARVANANYTPPTP